MAALVCEICGGKLMAKAGGLFECEYCGMQYDKTRIQEMVQEIKGTVQVEGTVQVQGTVKVDAANSVAALIKRGLMEIERSGWTAAQGYFDQALSLDPENGDAHLGVVLSKYELKDLSALIRQYADELKSHSIWKPLLNDLKWLRKYGSDEVKAAFDAQDVARKQFLQNRKLKAAERREIVIKRRKEIASTANLVLTDIITAFALKSDGTVLGESASWGSICVSDLSNWQEIVQISGDDSILVGLRQDGTVVATGRNTDGQCDVGDWANITAVSASLSHTVGLRKDGTVVAVGFNKFGQLDVSDWKNVIAIEARNAVTFGLCADGTVLSTKSAGGKVEGLSNIIKIVAGDGNVVGLRSDGTVAGCKEAKDWTDIVDIDYEYHSQELVGLCADGTVESAAYYVEDWSDIVAISNSGQHVVGLRVDGTVVAVGMNDEGQCDISGWENIVAIATAYSSTTGLRADGTIISTDKKINDKTAGWKLFDHINTLDQERNAARKKAEELRKKQEEAERIAREKEEEKKRIATQRRNAGRCQHCGGELKGLFSKKCVSCGKPKDY